MDTARQQRRQRPTLDHVDDNILTLEQAADILGLSTDDVYQLVRAGELLGIKVPDRGWFVHRDQVDAYVAAHG